MCVKIELFHTTYGKHEHSATARSLCAAHLCYFQHTGAMLVKFRSVDVFIDRFTHLWCKDNVLSCVLVWHGNVFVWQDDASLSIVNVSGCANFLGVIADSSAHTG